MKKLGNVNGKNFLAEELIKVLIEAFFSNNLLIPFLTPY
jgi:hypothetical protein